MKDIFVAHQELWEQYRKVMIENFDLVSAIRKHRDSWLNGDDKCWQDNEELYRHLPEGYVPPKRDETVELHLCQKYIASCHAPHITYVSPQRRIEELEGVLQRLIDAYDGRDDLLAVTDRARVVLGIDDESTDE